MVFDALAIVGEPVGSSLMEIGPETIANLKPYMFKDGLIIFKMAVEQSLVVHLSRGPEPCLRCLVGINTHVGQRIIEVGIEIHLVVCVCCEKKHHLVGPLDRQPTAGALDSSTLGHHLYAHVEPHAVVVEGSMVIQRVAPIHFGLTRGQRIGTIAE